MAIHYVVLADLLNSHNDVAFIDVTSDAVLAALVTIGSNIQSVLLDAATRFASSTDLLLTGVALPALVKVDMFDLPIRSTAVLRQHKLVLDIPAQQTTVGNQFSYPLGDLGTGAFVFVAAPFGDVQFTIQYGTDAASALMGVPGGGVKQIQLTTAHTRVRIISGGVNPFFVQIAVLGHGQEFSATIVEKDS